MEFLRLNIVILAIFCLSGSLWAQISAEIHTNDDPTHAPLMLTLQDAIARAKQNLPQFLAAKTDAGLAHQDKVQARAAILPSINYENQFLYTQGNGTPAGVFIANNAVHEYVSQGNAHESINLAGGQIHDLRRAQALEDAARAKLEIASRGLVVTMTQNYYSLVVGQRKYVTAQNSFSESQKLFKITQDLERGGEVAHSDVVKAQIELNDRQRQLQDAQLEMENARLMLAVSVFPNFDQNFSVADDLDSPTELPSYSDVQTLAAKNNPEFAAAKSELIAANAEVGMARSAHFPSLAFDYWYGIDSTHFAVNNPGGVRNLGYAAAATLNVPIWSWGATQSKVKQAELNRDRTKLELSFTQRQLLANLQSFYREAETQRAQLDLLRQSFDLASESDRLVSLRYRSGEATILEVVDAQNTLAQAHNAYDEVQLRFRLAIAQLQTLTGAF
ncbi:MAG TPA: TolC family protein [Terriglobales bacterium]